jgi:uncharacterized protein (TIGR02996 family)
MILRQHVDAARAAIERGELGRALTALLDGWRGRPAASVADAIDRVSARAPALPALASRRAWIAAADAEDPAALASLLRDLVTDGVTMPDLAKRVAHLAALPPDPRVAARLVSLVREQPFTARSSKKPLWQPVFAALVGPHADPRSIAALGALDARAFGRTDMAGWLREQVASAIATLEARFPSPPTVTAALDRALASLAAIAGPATVTPPRATASSEADLLAQVYASPDDDAPRLVYADCLLDKGDPRGEFIQLQLRGGDPARAAALVAKHGEHWAGPLFAAFLVKYQYPLAWRRGFLDGGTLLATKLTKAAGAKLVTEPAWATVRWLALSIFDRKPENAIPLIAHPCMRSLRELVDVPDEVVARLASDDLARPLEILGVYGWSGVPTNLPGFRALVALRGLSALRIVRIQNATNFATLAPLWQSPALASRAITIDLVPISDDAGPQVAAALDKLPPPPASKLRVAVFGRAVTRGANGKFAVGKSLGLPRSALSAARDERNRAAE